MKTILTTFELRRNKYFKQLGLESDFKQNSNDLKHRNTYDHFVYKLIDSEAGRKQYCKDFIVFR